MKRSISETTVLVVEDRMHMRKIIRSILNGMGIKYVAEANDGRDALTKLKNVGLQRQTDIRRFDLVICDWMMPSMTGVELLEVIRKDPHFINLPFIMLTAESDSECVTRALQSGVTDYILKPFTAKNLEAKVRTVLDARK